MVVAVWFVTPAHACVASLLISNTKALRSSFQSCQLVWGSLCLAEGRGFGVKHSFMSEDGAEAGAAWLPLLAVRDAEQLLLNITSECCWKKLQKHLRKKKTPEELKGTHQ